MDEITFNIFLYVVIILSAVVHEYSHAFMANELGDDTAKSLGRLTLNPFKHIDIVGTVIVPLFLLFTSGTFIGWAKPVPYNPSRLRGPKDDLKIALAGPGANLAIAIIVSGLYFLAMFITGNTALLGMEPAQGTMPWFVSKIISVNVGLAIFNLIPVPPLDGSKILGLIMPSGWVRRIESLGILGIILALWIGMMIVPFVASIVFYVITGFGRLF